MAAIRTLGQIPAKYVLYALRATEEELRSRATGTTFEAIRGDDLRSHLFHLPPLPEQHRIVAEIEKHFTRLDASTAALKRAQANLKRYRASVLKAACEAKLVPTEAELAQAEGRDYEPASVLLERILKERRAKWEANELAKMRAKGREPKDDTWKAKYKEPDDIDPDFEPFEIPPSWKWMSLGCISPDVKDGPHYSPEYVQSGIPFLSARNIRPDGIDFSTAKYISEELHKELSVRCKPEYGDLLYTKGGTTGIARINFSEDEFSVWVHVAVLKLVPSVEPLYVQHALNSPMAYAQSQKHTHGVSNRDLGLTRMVKIGLPLPPLAEQRRIVAEVERHLSVIQAAENVVAANLKRAERLRQSILKKAFEGKLVPQDPTDEPASVLLERIKAEREQMATARTSKSRRKS